MERENAEYRGSFTISLDFELYWGMRDIVSIEKYEENLMNVQRVIPQILKLFERYDIHATWAIVGFLWYRDFEELSGDYPKILPRYRDERLCPYRYIAHLEEEEKKRKEFLKVHFAPASIEMIGKTAGQEIATHTFSHYYTAEPEIVPEAFEADIESALKRALEEGVEIESIVFPRNQIDEKSLENIFEAGVKNFRGNPEHPIYRDGEVNKSFLQRVYRLIDTYFDLSGPHISLPVREKERVCELKSSIFLRPYNRNLKFLEDLKLRRIQKAIEKAAIERKNFHLWWHPHNFGTNMEKNLDNLEKILHFFSKMREKHDMLSLNMSELGRYYA